MKILFVLLLFSINVCAQVTIGGSATMGGSATIDSTPPPVLTPVVVQSTAITGNTTATTTVSTFSTATTTGNAVVVCGGTQSMSGAAPSMPTATGATFTAIQQVDNSFDVSTDCYVAQNITGGQTAYTFNHCSSCNYEAIAYEVANIALTGSAIDGTPTNIRTFNNTSNPTGTTTPTSGKNIILFSTMQSGSTFGSSGLTSPWTSTLGSEFFSAYQIVTSPSGGYSATWPYATTFTNNIATIQALKTP